MGRRAKTSASVAALALLAAAFAGTTALAARAGPPERLPTEAARQESEQPPRNGGAAETPAAGGAAAPGLLERLEREERARSDARAAADAIGRAERGLRAMAIEEADRSEALAAAAAATALERRRVAMAEWHARFEAALRPVLAARAHLYRRMPHRMFGSVRAQCEAVRNAVETAAVDYEPAPERPVEVLARDLFVVYRDSARYCARGSYFSFTVQERRIRQLVADLIAALEPWRLEFPRAAPGPAAGPDP